MRLQVEVVIQAKIRELALGVGLGPTEQIVRAVKVDKERVGRKTISVLARSGPPVGQSNRIGLTEVLTDVGAGPRGEDVVIVADEASGIADEFDTEATIDNDDVVVKIDRLGITLQPNRAA